MKLIVNVSGINCNNDWIFHAKLDKYGYSLSRNVNRNSDCEATITDYITDVYFTALITELSEVGFSVSPRGFI